MAKVKEVGGSNAFTYQIVSTDHFDTTVALELGVDFIQPPPASIGDLIVPPCTDEKSLRELCTLINSRVQQVAEANIEAQEFKFPPLSRDVSAKAFRLVIRIRPQLKLR